MVRSLADDGEFLELWPRWAPQLVTAFARFGGQPVGFVANQPRTLAGTLDIAASQKGARFVRLLRRLQPADRDPGRHARGSCPGKDLEWRGMIRHGAELAFAYAEATVPRVCLILRKAYGGAYIVMDSKGMGNDLCLAWPGAEVAVMGAPGAVQILHRGLEPGERADREAGLRGGLPQPVAGRGAGLRRPGHRPGRHPDRALRVLRQLATKRELVVGRKHDAGPQ